MAQSDSGVQLAQRATTETLDQLEKPGKMAQSVHAVIRVLLPKLGRLVLMAIRVKLDRQVKLVTRGQ
jgi:hypothetical protein